MAKVELEFASRLRERMEGIQEWITDEAPYIIADQRQLDANTPEQAYWHYGYQAALRDVLNLVEGASPDSKDTSN